MKKVRVLKEMPFAKVGEELDLNDNTPFWGYITKGGSSVCPSIETLMNDGWLEWVEEEKRLEDKFIDSCTTFGETTKWEVLVSVAKQHTLEVVKKALKPHKFPNNDREEAMYLYICKALEDC